MPKIAFLAAFVLLAGVEGYLIGLLHLPAGLGVLLSTVMGIATGGGAVLAYAKWG